MQTGCLIKHVIFTVHCFLHEKSFGKLYNSRANISLRKMLLESVQQAKEITARGKYKRQINFLWYLTLNDKRILWTQCYVKQTLIESTCTLFKIQSSMVFCGTLLKFIDASVEKASFGNSLFLLLWSPYLFCIYTLPSPLKNSLRQGNNMEMICCMKIRIPVCLSI